MWPNSQFPADLVTFTEEILNGKLNFSGSVVRVECTMGNYYYIIFKNLYCILMPSSNKSYFIYFLVNFTHFPHIAEVGDYAVILIAASFAF